MIYNTYMTPSTTTTTTTEAEQVYACICAIAARCDGAISQDGQGFNGADTKFGRRIAQIPFAEWTPEIITEAARILGSTYRVQAQDLTGIDARTLTIVREASDVYKASARSQARRAAWAQSAASRRQIRLEGSTLVFDFPFDATIKDALKAAGRGAFRFVGASKTWEIPVSALNADVVAVAVEHGFHPTEAAQDVLDGDVEEAPVAAGTGTAVLTGTDVEVTLTGHLNRDDFSEYRGLDSYRWIRNSPRSLVAASVRNLEWLAAHGFTGIEAIKEARAEQLATAAATRAASAAATSDLDLSDVVPEGLTPYPFQVAGVEYALAHRRVLIGDEMGLGKTVQAILAAEAAKTHPAVVVCPASLKGNWARELGIWAPGRTVSVLSGRTPSAAALAADYVIVNYDILGAWGPALSAIRPQALIVDESHYAKTPGAARTKALVALAQVIPADGLVLCLTGTPILNRPVELISQLQILGQLEKIAPTPKRGTAPRDWEYSFKYRFCGPQNNGYGWTFTGSSNELALNETLRSTCLIRRERDQVLDLQATTRLRVSLSLNGALKDYRAAEANVIAWLRTTHGEKAAAAAKRAETLVRLNTLRKLAEEAKIASTIEWVEDWLESYPDRKLVIFAGHVSVQRALVERFGCPSILAGQKDVEAQKEAFQTGSARIIVCSLQAAREGHTLTAASDVAFTSLGWTPGGLQQAEDRCNRIGQTRQVVAWQLHAEDTIDEVIADLIAAKRAVFAGVVQGVVQDDDEESIVEGVTDYLLSR